MSSPFLGEMLGTLVLVLLGDGVVAGVLLNGTKSQSRLDSGGWLMINTGWAVAVLCGIFVAQATGSPDAHINPAVTIALGALSGDFSKVSSYIPAQMLGAFLGAGLVWLHYHPHWRKTENPDLKLAIFCTGPALRAPVSNLVSEIIATSLLVFVIAAIVSQSVGGATGLQAGFASYLIAMLVWGIGLSLGGTTGYALNPARDFGPRLAHAVLPIAGKGSSDWSYAPIPVVGPIIGAIIGAFVARLVVL